MALSWLTPDMLLESFEPAWSPDQAQALPPVCKPAQQVGEIMAEEPLTVTPATSLADAMALMGRHRFRHLPVVDAGKLVGILSDRDVLRFVRRGPLSETLVGRAMSRKLWTATRETPILTAASLMGEHHIGCLPVLDRHGHLVGIVSASDVLRCLSVHAPVQAWL